jgi:hypothetical protein
MKSAYFPPIDPREGMTMKLFKAQIITAAIAAMVAIFASPVLAADKRTDLLDVDAKNFSRPTKIDNKYMPLKPGTKMVYDGWVLDDEDKKMPHKVIYIVTDLVKEVNGIETVVVWKQDFLEGNLAESELSFRAQDDQGNVWHLGEAKELYDENVKIIGAKVWMDGFLGTKSGIVMPGKPAKGSPSFSQGYAKGVYIWDDRAQVRKLGEKVTIRSKPYKDVLVIEEWSNVEPKKGPLRLKYYAPGVGYLQMGFDGKDPVTETLALSKKSQLNAKEMDTARAEALLVEERSIYYGRDTKPPVRRQ